MRALSGELLYLQAVTPLCGVIACTHPPVRSSSQATPLASHRDFGLPAAARAHYSGTQPVCARRLPPMPAARTSPVVQSVQPDYYR